MERLERTVVQLWEARRLAEHADVPHGRLALLLLDNAAETLLVRNASTALVWSDYYGRLLRQVAHAAVEDAEGQRLRRAFEEKVVPKKERRRIEREFAALVDYVFAQDGCTLDPALGACLKILHRYRNAAYHHDTIQPDVLGPAVDVYFYLCCELLKDQRALAHEIALPPPAVAEVVQALGGELPSLDWIAGATTSNALGVVVADLLLADRQLDHGQISARLAEHLTGRIRALERDLGYIREYMGLPSIEVTLRYVQLLPEDLADATADPPEDFWTRPIATDEAVLRQWRENSAVIRTASPAHESLRAFAKVEDALVALEEPVARVMEAIEGQIQAETDRRLGK